MSNFTGSMKSGDMAMTTDILVNEISDFIVHDTKTIVAAMNKAGVKVSEANSDEEIGDAIIGNIGTNKTLAKALAFIIADANELINNGTPDKKKWTKIVDTIAEGISELGKNVESNKVAFKDNLIQTIKTKAEVKGDYKRTILTKDKSSAKAVYYILGGLAFVGLVIWLIAKRQKADLGDVAAMASGGTIPTGVDTALPPIVPPTSPAPIMPPVAPIQTPPAPPIQQTTPAPPVVNTGTI